MTGSRPGHSSRRSATPGSSTATRPARPPSGDVELDALRERQVARVVDRVGLAPHVDLPGVGTRFAAAARVLLAAERAADLGTRSADVDVGNAAVAAGRRQEPLRMLEPVRE